MPYQTLPALLEARVAASPNTVAQWRSVSHGRWLATTWNEYKQIVAKIARGFRRLGVKPGDRVGIISSSSERWDWTNMAILGARGVVVGIDLYATGSQISDIVNRAGLIGLVVRDSELLTKVEHGRLASLKFIVVLSANGGEVPEQGLEVITLDDLMILGAEKPGELWDQSKPNDPAILVFTSGTTGAPKGIIYRHSQVCMAIDGILEAFGDVKEGIRLICWLPLANIFQRVINLCAIARGAQTYYVEDPKDILERLPEIAPHVFIGVPRFFEKQYAGIMDRLNESVMPIRVLARWAIGVGAAHALVRSRGRRPGLYLQIAHAVADAVLLRWIRKIVWGGQLRYLISGSAPMPMWLLEGFHALGLPVLEAYGMSECIVPVASNHPGAFKFGTVGQLMRGNEIKLGDDGELLLRGPGVFDGYFGEDEYERKIDAEGFFASGDFVLVDKEGYITLKGRKSEVFKTSTGRRVAPAPVEALLRSLPYVEDAAVYGAGQKALVAVLCLSPMAPISNIKEEIMLQSVYEHLRSDIQRVTQPLPAYLRPKGFLLVFRPFTIEGGELTANLKLRRDAVVVRHARCINELYALLEDNEVPKPFRRVVEPGVTEMISL